MPKKRSTPSKKPLKAAPHVIEPELVEDDEDEAAEQDQEQWDNEIDSDIESKRLPAPKTAKLLEGSTQQQLPSGPISVSDPLRRYFEEIKRYPLLTPEEEFQLAVKLRDTGDIHAAKALVSANLRLVVKIAYEYCSFYSNLLDLVQEGNIGLMKAVSKFDPTKGARFGYYASWWIRSYILKYLIDNFRLVKIGTTQAQKKLFYRLMREKDRLEAQGLLAGPKLLAEKLNVREQDIVEMSQRLSSQGAELSLDTPIVSGETKTHHLDSLQDPHESPEETLSREQWLKLLADRLPVFRKTLKEKEIKILDARVLSENPKTLQEVADEYGLTRERVRQIESKLIEKLREFLKKYL